MKFRLTAAVSIAVTCTGAIAAAQEAAWLSDRQMSEGIGIRTGNFELHPGVAAEAGYDSNYFLRSGEEGDDVVPVWRLRVTPSLSLATLGQKRRESVAVGAPPSLTMRASLWAAYNELIAADSTDSEQVSDNRHLDLGVSALVNIAPARPVGGDLYGDFVRTGEPSKALSTDVAFDRGSARVGGGVIWRPGGGVFDWRVGYELRYNYFEDAGFVEFDNFQHTVNTRGRWRFLPRTAVLYDGSYSWVRYTNETAQNDGDYVQARGGLNGLITNRFAFLALLGWNSSYYEDTAEQPARNYDGFVAHGEVKWFLMPGAPAPGSANVGLSSIAAGYHRSFSNSYLGAFYVVDRGYVNFNYFVSGVFVVHVEAGLGNESYPESAFIDGNLAPRTRGEFSLTRFDSRVFGEYRFSDTLAVNTTLSYEQRFGGPVQVADTEPDPGTGMVDGVRDEELAYRRWQAWVGFRWFM